MLFGKSAYIERKFMNLNLNLDVNSMKKILDNLKTRFKTCPWPQFEVADFSSDGIAQEGLVSFSFNVRSQICIYYKADFDLDFANGKLKIHLQMKHTDRRGHTLRSNLEMESIDSLIRQIGESLDTLMQGYAENELGAPE